ncbi:MoaF C-terminal domain-containing protein [Nonomuraea sp. NPDC050310]|uniref:MoaF C-terminal domain-containing protein n=1 Tax=Nonomuraea sp. NPDC050310 TaxID=3154935 RepID=UPI0033C7DF1C
MSSGWKTMDDFAPGIATNRLPATDRLAGTALRLAFADGSATRLDFRTGAELSADGGPAQPYEAVPVREDLLFLGHGHPEEPRRHTVTVVHTGLGRALRITSTIAEEAVPGEPRVAQAFTPGTVEGTPVRGEPPAPTRELIGRRALYRYSPDHLYEHVYLSSTRYAWQCLVGAQRGHGDVDLAATWKLADDLYVFTFREFRIPVAATWLYDWAARRTVGTFFGLSGAGEIHASPGGAHIEPLGTVTYPPGEEPA